MADDRKPKDIALQAWRWLKKHLLRIHAEVPPRPGDAPRPEHKPQPKPTPPPAQGGEFMPRTGDFLYSEPDMVSRNERNHPATRKCLSDFMTPCEPYWGVYVGAILRLLNPNMDVREFESNLRGLFNGARAFDNGRGINSGEWAIENLFCAGATLELIDSTIRRFGPEGFHYMRVRAIDPKIRRPIPRSLSEIDMTLHFFATTATATGNNPFPQFEGRVIIPFFGKDGENWVNIDGEPSRPGKMRRVTSIQHPFVPARPDITRLGL